MRQLRLVGLDEDGAHVVVESPTGDQFRLPVDERLRAACRGDLSRLGQIEIELDTGLRPKEIQARVRAGESPEEVAAAAGVSLDRILRFAYPVVQERLRVVAQARATRVRRGGSTPAETLAELVGERLVDRGTDEATLAWDAWRREDGAWSVRLRWQGTREHSATWTFDLTSRTLHAEDPAAEQLIAHEFQLRTITPVTALAAAATRAQQDREPAGGTAAGEAGTDPGVAGRGASRAAGREPGREPGREAGREAGEAESGRPTGEDAGGADGDDERGRRAHVPPWDDILLGIRRRRTP